VRSTRKGGCVQFTRTDYRVVDFMRATYMRVGWE
jgi:hypothetical protein